jgi:hypothetical protein
MSPLITADYSKVNALAKDLSTVVDYLGDAITPNSSFIDNNEIYI